MLGTTVIYLTVLQAATFHCRADEDVSNFTDIRKDIGRNSADIIHEDSMELFDGTGHINDSSDICPPGSELVASVCKCNQDLCEPPPCDGFLNIVRNGTDNPTSCCPVYTCDNCTADTNRNGTCACGEEAFLNSKGVCECVDPHKSFMDNTCVCDLNKCELPLLCDNHSLSFKEKDGCCYKTTCIRCPEDTYPTNFTSEEIENKCLCYPCPDTQCNETHTPFVLQKGTNFANQCCDLYECVPKISSLQCTVNHITYNNGEWWMTNEKQNCSCTNGVALCDEPFIPIIIKQHCIYNDIAYPHLATWTEDTCTNCTCNNGTPKCIAHFCNITETIVAKYKECLYDEYSYQHLENWQTKNCLNCTCYDGTSKCELYPCDLSPTITRKPICPPLDKCKKECKHGFKSKRGCDICKCKSSEKPIESSPLDIYMKNHNLSESDVLDLLKGKSTDEHPKAWHIIVLFAVAVVVVAFGYHMVMVYRKKCCDRYCPVLKHSDNNNISMEGDIKYISEKKPLKT